MFASASVEYCAPEPLKTIEPQLPGLVLPVDVNVIGCEVVPAAFRIPFAVNEAPLGKVTVVPGRTMSVWPELIV